MRLSYLFNAIGLVLIYIGLVTLTPVIIAVIYNDYFSIIPFLTVSIISIFSGFSLKLIFKKNLKQNIMSDIKKQEALSIVVLTWIVFSIIAAMPYLFYGFSIENAFFEGVSGITATGATIFTNFDYPKAIFFWRALTHWLGGMGIIVLFIAILPQFAVAGRQMFFAEAPGPTEDKLTPRIKNTATALWGLYIVLTLIQIILLILLGMNPFDSICNAFATLSAGGFATTAKSIEEYNSVAINWVFIVFMFFAGTNLALFYRAVTKFNFKLFLKNEEFRAYFLIVATVSLGISTILYFNNNTINLKIFTDNVFTTVSLITSTGFTSYNYNLWPIAAQVILFITLLFGSCAGSTGGGVKIIRILIVFKYLKNEIVKLLHPNAVITIKSDEKVVPKSVISQILAFLMFYIVIFLIVSISTSIIENNVIVGISGTIATLNLVGPGFGHIIGAVGNYDPLQPATKYFFMFNMLVGRLELIPFLILLNKDLWSFKK